MCRDKRSRQSSTVAPSSVLWFVYTANAFRTFLTLKSTSHLVFVKYASAVRLL